MYTTRRWRSGNSRNMGWQKVLYIVGLRRIASSVAFTTSVLCVLLTLTKLSLEAKGNEI